MQRVDTQSSSLNVWLLLRPSRIFLTSIDHFIIITDHNPMIPILSTHQLDEIENHRIQRLRTCIMAYNFTAPWLKRAKNEAADAPSRHPHHSPSQGDDLAKYDIDTNDGLMITSQASLIAELRTSTLHQMEPENLRLQELQQYAKTTRLSKRSSSAGFQTKSHLYLITLTDYTP